MESFKLCVQSVDTYDGDAGPAYWTDGRRVFFLYREIDGADIDSFIYYPGEWATDKKYCYNCSSRLDNADRKTFEVLNEMYAKDKFNVWAEGGKVKKADAGSFVVYNNDAYPPYGYCKDKNHVYFYFVQSKLNVVRNALPETFNAINNDFGYDGKSVFWRSHKLKKADPKTWKILKNGYDYSKDKYIYFGNRIIKKADAETFEVIEGVKKFGRLVNYAKDKYNYYLQDKIITKDIFQKMANLTV